MTGAGLEPASYWGNPRAVSPINTLSNLPGRVGQATGLVSVGLLTLLPNHTEFFHGLPARLNRDLGIMLPYCRCPIFTF